MKTVNVNTNPHGAAETHNKRGRTKWGPTLPIPGNSYPASW